MNTTPRALSIGYVIALATIVIIALLVGAGTGRIGEPTGGPTETVTVTVTGTVKK